MLESRMDSKEAIRLAVCVPSLGVWQGDFGLSLVQMFTYMSTELFEADQPRKVDLIDKRSSNLPRVRRECLEDAILKGCSHALFIDSDQSFPYNTAHRLLAHKKEVVAANIALKNVPSFPTARARGASPQGVPITSEPSKRGLERVWRVGAGILLVDLELVKRTPRPWFEIRWEPKVGSEVGEDWFFIEQLEKAGAEIWVDHDLSREIGHVGSFVYGHIHIPTIEMEKAA